MLLRLIVENKGKSLLIKGLSMDMLQPFTNMVMY